VHLLPFVFVLLVMSAISVIYFVSDKSSPVVMRLLCSAHGLLGAVLFASAIAISYAGRASRNLENPYARLFIVPVISIVLSFIFFRGNKVVHLLQIFNLAFLLWALVVGTMSIGADWI
jgi:hypothetical protein